MWYCISSQHVNRFNSDAGVPGKDNIEILCYGEIMTYLKLDYEVTGSGYGISDSIASSRATTWCA